MAVDLTNKVRKQPKRARRSVDSVVPVTRRSAAARSSARGLPCTRCGEEHKRENGRPLCNGHTTRNGVTKPCGNGPIAGGTVCEKHGGASKHVKDNAKARLIFASAEGEVSKLLAECDLPEQHPIDGLLEVVRHTGAMMRLLGTLCAGLDLKPSMEVIHDEEGLRARQVKPGIWGLNHMGDQAQHVLVTLYGVWADRYMRACKTALDANIDERLVRNAEATSNSLFTAVEVALQKSDLTPAQVTSFTLTLGGELRKLIGPSVIDIEKEA